MLPREQGGEIFSDPSRPRYEPMRPLGEGGIGEVSLAFDQDIDRPVAIKRLRAEHQHTGALLRFAQEIRTIGSLEHPNIVPVHDVGVDDNGQHFFVMKYCEGETLENVIEKLQANDPAYHKRFPIEARSQVFLGILRAVQYAHARGIVHRDIKPANVMVGPFGEVMVMDWGIAKQLRAPNSSPLASVPVPPMRMSAPPKSVQTVHGSLIGTPAYMSPEQARGETDKIDERSDVYSLAVLFHEFFSLRHYQHDKETLEALLTSISTAADHERTIAGWVADAAATGAPMELIHFVRHGMAPNAADRYANAGEMAAALEDIMAGKIKMQCHISATKRVAHETMHLIDRHVLLATVALLGTIAAAVVGVVSIVRSVISVVHG